jgi:hypothetical protein
MHSATAMTRVFSLFSHVGWHSGTGLDSAILQDHNHRKLQNRPNRLKAVLLWISSAPHEQLAWRMDKTLSFTVGTVRLCRSASRRLSKNSFGECLPSISVVQRRSRVSGVLRAGRLSRTALFPFLTAFLSSTRPSMDPTPQQDPVQALARCTACLSLKVAREKFALRI